MSQFPLHGARAIWIASYPRSGNTFLRIILRSVFGLPSYSVYYVEGDPHADPSAEALEEAPRLPRDWREMMTDQPTAPPAIIKTHDPPADSAPAIFIARDGRAALDSYYHYHKKFAFEQPSLAEIIAGACQFGSWSDHYWAWRPRTRPETLLLKYDELVSNPEAVVEKLAGFLKLSPQAATFPGFEELHKRSPAFFRRGQNADYLKQWTPGLINLFNELHSKAMADLGFADEPTSDPVDRTVVELAQSAARLHRQYLEQLVKLGQSSALHLQERNRLAAEVEELRREIEEALKPQLRTGWVRLGRALGLQKKRRSGERSGNPEPTNLPGTQSAKKLKASPGNSQSSEPNPAPAPLSASNGDISARA